MSESLAELLRRTADVAREPRLDVGELVAQAGRRQRHRRIAIGATAAVAVGAVALGSFVLWGGTAAEPEPAPTPTVVDPQSSGDRPLVYAEGGTVHVGEESFDAGAPVGFVDATDDGVVFMTEPDRQLWFHDGSTSEPIGVVPSDAPGSAYVNAANPGSLVVWVDGASSEGRLVYDTSQRAVVGRLAELPPNYLLHVDESHVYYVPSAEPGCWVIDTRTCSDPQVLRYDVESKDTQTISQSAFEDELLRNEARLLVLTDRRASGTGTVFTTRKAGFRLDGTQLVPIDGAERETVFTRATGEPVALRVPAGYTPPRFSFEVVQWLDDDRIVLAGGRRITEPSWPDHADLLVCSLSDGECLVALQPAPSTLIAPAGG